MYKETIQRLFGKDKLNVLELFAGIHATSEGMRRAGIPFETFTVEFDQKVQDVANMLWNENIPVRDITKFESQNYKGQFDLVVGGFPCQTFSMAGERQGVNDEKGRGTLFRDTLRVIRDVEPKLVILENVKGILTKDHIHVVEEIKYEMEQMGYDLIIQTINAKHYVPQNRERVFFIGKKKGFGTPLTEVPVPNNRQIELKDLLDTEETDPDVKSYMYDTKYIQKMLDWEPSYKDDIMDALIDHFNTESIVETFNGKRHLRLNDTPYEIGYNRKLDMYVLPLSFETIENFIPVNKFWQNREEIFKTIPEYIKDKFIKYITYTGNNKVDIMTVKELENFFYMPAKHKITGVFDGAYNRVWKDNKIHPTLTTAGKVRLFLDWERVETVLNGRKPTHFTYMAVKGGFIFTGAYVEGETNNYISLGNIPIKMRSITPREAWRLMGWEDSQIDRVINGFAKSYLFKTAGNSMVVPVMQAIVEHILK